MCVCVCRGGEIKDTHIMYLKLIWVNYNKAFKHT